MNRKNILGISILATIALVGLILIQLYWIRNAIRIDERIFGRRVSDAALNVIHQLELNETEGTLKKSLMPGNMQDQGADSVAMEEPSAQSIDLEKAKAFMEKRMRMMDEVMNRMFRDNIRRNLEERVSKADIEKLLGPELERQGITIPYEYGVYCTGKNAFIFEKTGNYHHELLSKGMAFQLFPGDFSVNPDFLIIYFPQEERYLLLHVSNFLIISIILILIIIIAFAYSILTIYRQKKLSELKNDFINNMTHEFKTPISTVALACEALNDRDVMKSSELYSYYINIISEENRRLGTMAEQILQTALIEKGELRLHKEYADIHGIISEVVRNIKIQVEIKDGTIKTDFRAGDFILEVDRVHMTNIFHNLLENANKYSPRKPEIEISTSNSGGYLDVKVRDKGIGISKSDQKKIFDKLYRVPTGNIHDFKGFGLGLNYVRAIVEAHSGTIQVESELNKGSVFHIRLPLSRDNKPND